MIKIEEIRELMDKACGRIFADCDENSYPYGAAMVTVVSVNGRYHGRVYPENEAMLMGRVQEIAALAISLDAECRRLEERVKELDGALGGLVAWWRGDSTRTEWERWRVALEALAAPNEGVSDD